MKCYLVLTAATPDGAGDEVTRASFDRRPGWQFAAAGDAVAVFAGGRLRWFTADTAGPEWRPAWTVDLTPGLPEADRKTDGLVVADAGGVWVVRGLRVLRLARDGRKVAEFTVNDPWPRAGRWPESGHFVAPGGPRLYFHHPRGVIALDPATGAALWHVPTPTGPYPGLVVDAGGLALVRIGSGVPATLRSALFGGEWSIPKAQNGGPDRVRAAATLLHAHGDGYLKPRLHDAAARLRGPPGGAAHAAAVEARLASWPAARDRQRLLDACVAALLHAGPAAPADTPAGQRTLCWCLLQELVYDSVPDGYPGGFGDNYCYHVYGENPAPLPDATRAALVEHCRRTVAAGPAAERAFAASVLVSQIGWGRLPDAERKALLLSADPGVWRWAAFTLARNGRRSQLVAWGRDRPPADHLDILWILKADRPKVWAEDELKFWVDCARRDAPGVATALGGADGPPPAAFRAPVRAYLEREAANPADLEQDSPARGGTLSALLLLDAWRDPADVPVLLAYLKHPYRVKGHRVEGAILHPEWDYRIRGYAKSLLEKRNVPVPPGVVVREPAPPDKE